MPHTFIQVKFDEYRELYTVPLDEVIPRVSTHEQNDDDDMAAVYKRRRREDKEKAARDAALADTDEDDEESSKGPSTGRLHWSVARALKSGGCCPRSPDAGRGGGCLGTAHARDWFASDEQDGSCSWPTAWCERASWCVNKPTVLLIFDKAPICTTQIGQRKKIYRCEGFVPCLSLVSNAGSESSTSRFNLTKPIEIRVLPPGRSLDFITEKPKVLLCIEPFV